jgi:poly(A) polymerase
LRKKAISLVKILQDKGHLAFFVGGHVRDRLLGLSSDDIDIATSATPDEVTNIFGNRVYPGIGKNKKFGIVIVRIDNVDFEVATFRTESDYNDGRHPNVVNFPVSAEVDASRRDFTINGLFEDPITGEIYDFVNGLEDINNRVIRFIGDPMRRITEDKLRLIRGPRFEAKLCGFELEPASFNAIRANASLISSISLECIKDELMKAFKSSMAHSFIARIEALRLLEAILPEISRMRFVPHPEGDVLTHTILVLGALRNAPPLLKLSGLFHDVGKPDCSNANDLTTKNHEALGASMTEQIMKRLRFSNAETKYVAWLVKNHMRVKVALVMKPAELLRFAADPRFNDLLELLQADNYGSLRFSEEPVRAIKTRISELSRTEKVEIPNSLLTGKDIMDILKLSPGPRIRELKSALVDAQLEGKIINRIQAIDFIERINNEKNSIN